LGEASHPADGEGGETVPEAKPGKYGLLWGHLSKSRVTQFRRMIHALFYAICK